MKKFLILLLATCTIFSVRSFSQVSLDWLRYINDHSEGGVSIATDNVNNTYALGNGGGFIYLTKRDKFGNFQWQQSSTSYLGENAVRVFVDSHGNAVAVGYRYSTLHEGPFAVALIVLKYTSAGQLLYKTVIPGTYTYFNNSANRTNVTAVMDVTDNVYIATGGIVSGYPSQGFNVVKISSGGNLVRVTTQTFGGSPFYLVSNIRIKENLLGLTGPTVYYEGNPGVWILDTAGNTKWSKVITGFGSQDIAIDDNKNIYVISLLSNVAGANTNDDVTLYKFGATGNQLWLKGYDFGSSEIGLRIEITPDKNLALMSEGSQINGGLPYVDWLTLKVNADGNLLWSKRYDKTINNDEIPSMMMVDKSGNIYVTGAGGPFPGGSNLGALQGVTLKYSSRGALRWRSLVDTLSFDGRNLALGIDTSVFVISASASAVIHLLQTNGSDACAVPSNLNTTAITNSSATITWNAVANAFLYHVQYKTATSNVWTQISTDSNHYTLSNLYQGTTYDYSVEAICNSGLTGFSPAHQFTTLGTGYCSSKGLNSSNEWIDLVMLGAISGVSGNDGGYGDYTYLSTDLSLGSTNSITTSADIPSGLYTEAWEVWIDYNHNSIFESNELVVNFKSSQIGWEIHSFTLPISATLGPTRMRVIMKFKQYAQPCEIFSRGEVEDYTVNITSQNAINLSAAKNMNAAKNEITGVSIFPNPAKNYINLNLTGFKGAINISLYDVFGKLIQTKQVTNEQQIKLDVSLLKSGVYVLRIFDKTDHYSTGKFIKE